MLDRRAHPLALHALDVTDCHARGEIRVFTKVLKVSTVHWSTVDVDSWCEEKMDAFRASVASEFDADQLDQRRVPGSCEPDPSGKSSSWSKVADAERSVGHL